MSVRKHSVGGLADATRKIALASAVLGSIGSARMAGPTVAVGVEVVCPATGAGAAICIPVGMTLHEIVQLLNGNDGFGPNGEVMKLLMVPVNIVDGNIQAAEGESGEIAKVLRATTGISIRDIEKYGLAGGPNSVLRKPLGTLFE